MSSTPPDLGFKHQALLILMGNPMPQAGWDLVSQFNMRVIDFIAGMTDLYAPDMASSGSARSATYLSTIKLRSYSDQRPRRLQPASSRSTNSQLAR